MPLTSTNAYNNQWQLSACMMKSMQFCCRHSSQLEGHAPSSWALSPPGPSLPISESAVHSLQAGAAHQDELAGGVRRQ